MVTNRQILSRAGISQQELADRLGIGKASVNQALHGVISSRRIWHEMDALAHLPEGTAEANALAEKQGRKTMAKRPPKMKTPLRLKRMATGMLQQELADALSVRQTTLSRWEVHGVTSIRAAVKLGRFFHCPWQDFISLDDRAYAGASK